MNKLTSKQMFELQRIARNKKMPLHKKVVACLMVVFPSAYQIMPLDAIPDVLPGGTIDDWVPWLAVSVVMVVKMVQAYRNRAEFAEERIQAGAYEEMLEEANRRLEALGAAPVID